MNTTQDQQVPQAILGAIMAKAQSDHPHDYSTQEYVIQKQIGAYLRLHGETVQPVNIRPLNVNADRFVIVRGSDFDCTIRRDPGETVRACIARHVSERHAEMERDFKFCRRMESALAHLDEVTQ